MNAASQLRVSVLGRGERAMRWSDAVEGVAQRCPASDERPGDIDALVIAPGVADPFARAKEALLAGLPVLHAAPSLLSPWQAGVLRHLSLREGVLLRFFEPFRYRPGFAFLRRALEGGEPLWRPTYLRTLCLALPGGPGRLDELATEQLAMCDALLDWQPRHVVAAASRRDAGDVCAAFLTIHSGDAPLVQCTVSLAEVTEARQLVVASADCTVVMDDMDPLASLRVLRAGEEDVIVGERARRNNGQLLASPGDAVTSEAARFVEAVAHGDTACSNAERWVRVASLWWAARQSMTFGGATQVPIPAFQARETEPPPLRVIEGGGKTVRSAGRRPALSVVSR